MPEQTSSHQPVIDWSTDQSEYARYLLRSPQEIVQVLRGVARARELVTVYFDHGQRFFLSSIVLVEPTQDALFLDWGVDEEQNRRALAATHLVCITTHERVKVQFALGPLEKVELNGRPAFRAHLPKTLLKLQRREYYRLVVPLRSGIVCRLPVAGEPVEARVGDISVGGLGLTDVPPTPGLEVGALFPGAQFTLPGEGDFLVTLEVRSVQELALRHGGLVRRVGCRFVDLPPAQQARIQRYIIRVERERLALAKGS